MTGDKLDFNRKVDVLVAMHVMGWKDRAIVVGYVSLHDIPLYSTSLSSAWDVVKKFDYFYLFRAKNWKNGNWECKLVWGDADTELYGWAETEQLAICYAGLKAVGFDVKGFLKEEGKT